ncbi:hypothetical protein TNCV_3937401 [Trichonephila clavipes]|nr:hypothetical protein TNCV_3937401 [Trichonephila clavipes]
MGTYGSSTGVIRSDEILIVRCSLSGGFSVLWDRSPPYSHRSLKSLNTCLTILTPESTVPRTTLSTALIMEPMISLTTSASTIEPLIIPNSLTFISVGFPLPSTITRVSVVNSGLPPIFLPIPVWESIARALICISEFLTLTPDPSV